MNTVLYFEIQISNPERAAAFYTAIFGWTFFKDPQQPFDYWQIKTEGINGGLLPRPSEAPSTEYGANAFVCSVKVEDFDATAAMILQQGGKVALEKFAVPGRCWQGYFIDPEKNAFGLFQVDEKAV